MIATLTASEIVLIIGAISALLVAAIGAVASAMNSLRTARGVAQVEVKMAKAEVVQQEIKADVNSNMQKALKSNDDLRDMVYDLRKQLALLTGTAADAQKAVDAGKDATKSPGVQP